MNELDNVEKKFVEIFSRALNSTKRKKRIPEQQILPGLIVDDWWRMK